MNDDLRPFLERFLDDGPRRVPDRVVQGAMERIASAPQDNRAAPWRYLEMSTVMRLAVASILAIAVGGVIYGGSGLLPATAPAASSPSPTVTPARSAAPHISVGSALVKGTQDCKTVDEGTTKVVSDVSQTRDAVLSCTWSMDDPRVSGAFTTHVNTDCYFDNAASEYKCLGWSTQGVLTGPDGTWVGGSIAADNEFVSFFQGTEAYEGWTFATLTAFGSDAVTGVVYQGPPPAWRADEPITLVPAVSPAPSK
jgi:hypothetical protein